MNLLPTAFSPVTRHHQPIQHKPVLFGITAVTKITKHGKNETKYYLDADDLKQIAEQPFEGDTTDGRIKDWLGRGVSVRANLGTKE